MLKASQAKPQLVTQIVPSPITFTWDATIQGIIKEQKLGQLLYIEVRAQSGKAPQPEGSELTRRQDIDLSGLNIMKLGILYEALQRYQQQSCWPIVCFYNCLLFGLQKQREAFL